MITSTLGMSGSVNSRNLVPVTVWKQVMRNLSVSSTSSPVLGSDGLGSVVAACVGVDVRDEEEPAVAEVPVEEETAVAGISGVRERVMAWTLRQSKYPR